MPAAKREIDRLIDAALSLAGQSGWRSLALADIAAAAGLSLARVHSVAPSKMAILAALMRRTDMAVLAGRAVDRDEEARDRLFEVLMRRFDLLAPAKPGLRAIVHDTSADLGSILCLAPSLGRSMAWMLEAAGIDAGGWRGRLRVKGLSAIYLSVLRIWLQDETTDQSKTMAVLDRALRQGEQVLRWCEDVKRFLAAERTEKPAKKAEESPSPRSKKIKKKKK